MKTLAMLTSGVGSENVSNANIGSSVKTLAMLTSGVGSENVSNANIGSWQ